MVFLFSISDLLVAVFSEVNNQVTKNGPGTVVSEMEQIGFTFEHNCFR